MKDINKNEQKLLAEECNKLSLVLNDKYYLINSRWYQKWADYVGLNKQNEGSEHPGAINNNDLLESNGSLKTDVIEEADYMLVHEKLWNLLKDTYGIQSDKDIIERRVINDAMMLGQESYKVEVKYSMIKTAIIQQHTNSLVINNIESSRQAKLVDVVKKMKEILKIPIDKDVRLYMRLNQSTFNLIDNLDDKTLSSIEYTLADVLCLNVKKDDGTWPEIQNETSIPLPPIQPQTFGQYPSATPASTSPMTTRSSSAKNSSFNNDSSYSNRYNSSKPGLCGLNNLGNTCFMNSAIQCMSNVPLLTKYFMDDHYIKEINKVNPLGQNGELAIAYAELIKEMWNGQNSYTSPRQLKLHISRVAPQFIGYQQQDSQELLSYLLDGLHEDLNRILKKPYIEINDDDTKTDEELSKETWENYKKRNDSIIVDSFHGLVKSTLNCLVCNKISVKFDPICYLSLPLPSKKERLIEVTYVPLDTTQKLTKYKLNVFKNGTINDLCNALEPFVNVPKQRLAVCDIYNSKIFHLFETHEPVSNIRERDEIYVYQLENNFNSQDHFRFYFYLKSKSNYTYNSSNFGLPFVFLIPQNELNVNNLYEKSNSMIRRLIGDEELNLSDLSINSNDDVDNKKPGMEQGGEESKYFFKLFLSKSDNYEYNDSPSIDENVLSQLTNFTQNYLIIAECPLKLKNHLQDNKFNVIEHESCNAKLVNRRDVLTLDDCFSLFTKKEELSDSDLWFCPKCKQHQHATKQMDLWSLAPVLIIHLKRFSYSRIYRDKIDTLVEFPIKNLDLNNYIKNTNKENKNFKYNLIAVSNHYGGLGGGHYTAYGQNYYDGRWYNFDDSSVSSSDETSVCTPAAYLLVYLREDLYDNYFKPSSSTNNDNSMDTS